ncbi:MAG: response regulator [Pseudomonadota bacterium]|nr:response regulator [Pseudomonadota bacterium]
MAETHGGSLPGEDPRGELRELKVLLLEDSELIAMHMEEMLADGGCDVVATLDTVAAALEYIRSNPVDAAVLDVNLRGEKVFGVAADLKSRGIPFVFSTGAGERFIPPEFDAAPHLSKPFEPEELWLALAQARRAVAVTSTSDISPRA